MILDVELPIEENLLGNICDYQLEDQKCNHDTNIQWRQIFVVGMATPVQKIVPTIQWIVSRSNY